MGHLVQNFRRQPWDAIGTRKSPNFPFFTRFWDCPVLTDLLFNHPDLVLLNPPVEGLKTNVEGVTVSISLFSHTRSSRLWAPLDIKRSTDVQTVSETCRVVRTIVPQRSFKEVSKNWTWMHEMRRRLVWLGRSTTLLLYFLCFPQTEIIWDEILLRRGQMSDFLERLCGESTVWYTRGCTPYISCSCQGFPPQTQLPLNVAVISSILSSHVIRFVVWYASFAPHKICTPPDVHKHLYTYKVLYMGRYSTLFYSILMKGWLSETECSIDAFGYRYPLKIESIPIQCQ